MLDVARISVKGQVTIPIEIRKKTGFERRGQSYFYGKKR
jgi:bifunctional DNA-binding transcriptional regulator/antitoxin component of YhaV-PrlF toxin-antitoxin module